MAPFTRRRTAHAAMAFLTLAAGLTASAGPASSAAQSVRDVVARAAEYSVAYGEALASVVAVEGFEQELVVQGAAAERRRLDSEIAFVWLAGSNEWLAFRNVIRVDGVELPDAAGRLERVFRTASRSALAQARALTAESARHNLGPVQRTFNVPTTVLHFLLPQHQDRFRFRKSGEERIGGDNAWMVEFRERDRATFIRTAEGRDAPARGRLWIVPADGRIVRSQMLVKTMVEAEIDVDWRHEDRLKLWVPAEMRERYRGRPADGDRFELRGVARYSEYRRFEVDARIVR